MLIFAGKFTDCMKKLTVLFVAALLAIPAFAQHERSSSAVASFADGAVTLDIINHTSFSYGFVKSDAFVAKGSGEVSLNVLGLDFYPSPSFGIESGLDCKWQIAGSRESVFGLFNNIPQVLPVTDTAVDERMSSLTAFSLTVPVFAKFYLGKWFLGGGAEANFNLTTFTDSMIRKDNVRIVTTETKGKARLFTYDLAGMIGYEDLALIGKFYPKHNCFVPDGGVQFNTWTLGVIFFL